MAGPHGPDEQQQYPQAYMKGPGELPAPQAPPTQEEAARLVREFHDAHPEFPSRLGEPEPGVAGTGWLQLGHGEQEPGLLAGFRTGKPLELPASGAPMENVRLVPDRDYPADADLLFERGSSGHVLRMTPADQVLVGAAVLGPDAVRALVIDYLYEVISDRDPDAGGDNVRLSDMAGRDIDALERVIAMLRGES